MKANNLQNARDEAWFMQRIGKKVIASSPMHYNGEMVIKDEKEARYLCNYCQVYQAYEFDDIDVIAPSLQAATA